MMRPFGYVIWRLVINNQVQNKIKVAIKILSWKGRKYDENMRYLIFSKTKLSTLIN